MLPVLAFLRQVLAAKTRNKMRIGGPCQGNGLRRHVFALAERKCKEIDGLAEVMFEITFGVHNFALQRRLVFATVHVGERVAAELASPGLPMAHLVPGQWKKALRPSL